MQRTVYYTHLASPWGSLFLAGTDKGICACRFMNGKDQAGPIAAVMKQNSEALIKEDSVPLTPAIELLRRYFSGEPERFLYPLDLHGSTFQTRVWSALREIPLGTVATYGEIAGEIGSPRAARAVGQACGRNQVVLFVPCHRVVAAHGKLGGFGGGLNLKKALLRHEGWVEV
ncbi:MAG: methylated-DNA--[protein]-cysteine S-methyltransferase [Deltaproteobacteria bacterium]|nr:MAG: methylated-DNA--[protein]-cysteine S-methyltransferase [Deltaproteobacteria bacterium]